MWNRLNGKSNGAVDDRQSQSSRDKRSTRRRSESEATSDLTSKSSRNDHRDRASNTISNIDSSAKRSAFPGTASASNASSYATAKSRTGRDDNDGKERVSERRKKDRSPSPERRRDKKGRNDSRERKERKRERLERHDRMDGDIAKDSGRSEYNYSNGRTQESTRGDFNAQIGSSGFVQFPGQYEGGFVGGPPTRAGDMSSHVPDQFPGQFPTASAGPYRPPLSVNEGGPGLAADYYGDVGQSLSEQPGVRPQQPSLTIGAEPHLQPASSTARPPPESSALSGVGAAASFSDHFDAGTTNVSHQTSSSKPGSTYTASTVRPNTQNTSTSASAIPIMGAAAAGAAAGYFASTAINAHEHQSQHASSTAGNHSTMNQRPPSYSNGYYDANSQYITPITSGKNSSQTSNIPLYGAGAVGLAAAAHHPHHQSSPYHSTSQPFPTGSMALKHRHRGPLSTFVDFFKDTEGVAQFEEYTEYIGVCRDCFAPGSSPQDAPRKHNYRRRRSDERYGSSMRVDKDSRYSSSDSEKRRKKNKSWLEAGIAGYSLGKVGQTLFNQGNNFDDAYSVKSGRIRKSHGASSPDRKSYTSRGTTRRSYEATHRYRSRSREHVETGITSDGKIYKKDLQGGKLGTSSVTTYRVRRRSKSRSRSRSHSRDRKNRLASAAVGATIGTAVVASKSRRRDSSPERTLIRIKGEGHEGSSIRSSGHGKRHSPRHESNLASGSHIEGRRRSHGKKKKKNRGFFSFGNSSSSSDISSGIDSRYNKRREKKYKDNVPDDHRKAQLAVAGLSAAAAALTLEQTRQNNKSRRRGDVVAVKEAKEKRRHESERRRRSKITSSNSDEDVWESASEGDADSISSDLAYGSAVRRQGSRSSLSSDSSATSKWLWRWGSKKKSSDRDRKSSSPPYAGIATSAADESIDTRKMDDVDDRRSRITMQSNSSLPLQQVYPVPTSDPLRFDVATKSSALPPSQSFIDNRPDLVQIQHPQPITPVSPAVYTTQSPYSQNYSVSAGGPSDHVDFVKRTSSEPISGAYHDESQRDVPGRFQEPLISTDNTAHGASRDSKTHRKNTSLERHAPEVVQTSGTPRRRTSLREGSSMVRFDLPEDKSEGTNRAKPHQIERDYEESPRKDRYKAEDPEQLEREAQAVKRSSRERSDLDKRRQGNLVEVEDRQHSHEKSSSPGKSISWAVPAAIGAAALAGATIKNQETRSDDSEEERRERRRRRREARRVASEGVSHDVEASKSEDDSSRRREDESTWHEAAETTRTPSYEDYAEFFAPTELLSKSPQYKQGAAEADAENTIMAYEVPEVITIEPTGFRDSREAPAYKFGPDGEEIDPDPIPPPWVPKLKLVSPTPQPSSVNGSESGDELPTIDPHAVAKEVSEVLRESHATTQDVLQDIETPEYTIIEPKGDGQENIRSPSRDESMRAEGSIATTTDIYQVGPSKNPTRESNSKFGDDLEFAGTLAAGLSEAGFDPSIVVDDPTFRRRESPPGSEKAGTYQSPTAEVPTTRSNEMSKSQVAPHEHAYVDDEVTSHMPGAFDEDEQILELTETESRLSKKERKKKDKQAKRQDSTGSYSNNPHGESIGQSRDVIITPKTQEQETTVLVEDPEEYLSDGAQPTAMSHPSATEASKDRETNKNLRLEGSAVDDDTSVATAPTIQAHADTYLVDEARSMTASTPAATETTKDRRKKKKSRRSGSAVDDVAVTTPPLIQARDLEERFSDDARSSVAIPKERRKKKSKRGDSAHEEEFSVVSSSTTRDEAKFVESKPRSKKGGLFGLFGRSSVDVSELSHPGTEATAPEAADVEEPKRKSKKRSKDRPSYRDSEEIGPIDADADDDSAMISGRTTLPPEVSIPTSTGHDPFLPSHNRLTNPEDEESGRSLEAKNSDLSSLDLTQHHDSHIHSQPIPFLGMRQDLPLPPDIPDPVDLVPKANSTEKSESFLEAIAQSKIASRRSSSPTSLHRAIEPNQGTNSLPSSPISSPKVPSQRLSELQKFESPQHTPSPTAVPFHFRIPPSSPSASRASASQPHTPLVAEAASAPSRPKLRPRSTEFKISNEFRPLWLVSKHASRLEGPIDEVYPSLPSSHTTSRSSSVHDANEYSYDFDQAFENQERSNVGTDVQMGGMGTEVDLGLLDSQQPTPTAASFPAAIRENMQPSEEGHENLDQPNLAATEVQLDELPPLPSSGPSSPAMSITQEPPRPLPNLKAITLGAVLGASVVGAVGAVHHQHASTTSSDREGKDSEPEMVETAPPRTMVSALAANKPVTIFENEVLRDQDRPAPEQQPNYFYTDAAEKLSRFDQPPAMLRSTQRGDVAPLSAEEQRVIQEQDTQDAVELLFSPTSEKRSPRELKRKGKKKGRVSTSTGLQSRDVGEPSANDISTATSVDDTEKPSLEELAMQEAINSIKDSNSMAEAKAQAGPTLTGNMPVDEVVERMSKAAEGPIGEGDTLPARSTTERENSAEVQTQLEPANSKKRFGKDMNRGSSARSQELPVETSSMALGEVRELEPPDRFEQYSVNEVDTSSMNIEGSDPAREVPHAEILGALGTDHEPSGLAVDYDIPLSTSKRKTKKGTKIPNETAQTEPELEHVSGAFSASQPKLDENEASTTDALISEPTLLLGDTLESISNQNDPNFKLASLKKSKKSKKNRKDLEQKNLAPKEGAALEPNFLGAERIAEDTPDPEDNPRSHPYQKTLHDARGSENSTYIPLSSTLSPELHVQPADIPLPESTDLDLFITTPPSEASPAEREPSTMKQFIVDSSATQVLPHYSTTLEKGSRSSHVATEQQEDPTNPEGPRQKRKTEKKNQGQSTGGEAISSAAHVGAVDLDQATALREDSSTIACDPNPLLRAADDSELHELLDHQPLRPESFKSEVIGDVIVPDEIELPELKSLHKATTTHDYLQHAETVANGANIIEEPFNEANKQESKFAQTSAVRKEQERKPMLTESAQTEMERRIPEIVSPEPAVGSGISSTVDMHFPQSESVIYDDIGKSPHISSGPFEDSSQLGSSLEASEPITADEVELPQSPVVANQPVSGTRDLKPRETPKGVMHNAQILVPEIVVDSSQFDFDSHLSNPARVNEAELPARRYSISENQPKSDQLDLESSALINDSRIEILEPIVATDDRPNASPSGRSPVQQSYNKVGVIPSNIDKEFHIAIAPSIQTYSPSKPEVSAFVDETLNEAKEPHQAPINNPTVNEAELKDGWNAPGQPAKTDTSQSVKEILGTTGTRSTEEKTPASLTTHTVDSEVLVPQIQAEGNDDNSSGFSKKQRKKGKKSRMNKVPKPASDFAEPSPTAEPFVALTNTAEDVQTILDVGRAEQASAPTGSGSETVVPATELEIAEESLDDDDLRPPSSKESKNPGRRKPVERDGPDDSLIVEVEAPKAPEQPFPHIETLEDKPLLEHRDTTLHLEKPDDVKRLNASNHHGVEPSRQDKGILDQLNVGDMMENPKQKLLDEERVELVEVAVGQNKQSLHHPRSVDEVTYLEPGAFKEGYMKPVEQIKNTLDHVKHDDATKGTEPNATEEDHLELMRSGKEVSNSHSAVGTAKYLEPGSAGESLMTTKTAVEEGQVLRDIVQPDQNIPVEPLEVSSAEANDLSLSAREVKNDPHEKNSETQHDAESIGITSAVSFEEKGRNELSATHQNFQEPSMSPVEVELQAPEPAELSDAAKALEEALESQDISRTAPSSSKKDKKKAKKKNKSAAMADEAHIPEVDSHEASGANKPTSDQQVQASKSDMKEKKRGKKSKQAFAWEESVASSADNGASTVQHGSVLDIAPDQSKEADEELDSNDLYIPEKAVNERDELARDRVGLDSATRAVEAAISSAAETNNNLPMSKKDKKKKRKATTSQVEDRNDDFPTPVTPMEAEFASTVPVSPAEPVDIPINAPAEGLEDVSSRKKKSKKDKKREKTQFSPWEEETAPQAEVVSPREAIPELPSQQSSETVANLAKDFVDDISTLRKGKKGKKGKKTGLQSPSDVFEPTRLENVTTPEIPISENPVQSVQESMPTIDEVREVEPAGKALDKSQNHMSLKSADSPHEPSSLVEIQPSHGQDLDFEEPESTHVISGEKGEENKSKTKKPSTLPWDENETFQVETTDADFSNLRTAPTSTPKFQDPNASLEAGYKHQAHGSAVQTPVTAVRDAPTEEATYEPKKTENGGFSPTTTERSAFPTELELLPDPDPFIKFSENEWKSKMQPRVLDLDEEIADAAPQVVDESIPEGSSKASLEQLIDEPILPHVPGSVKEPNQQPVQKVVQQHTEGPVQPHVGESTKIQLEEPIQSHNERSFEKPHEEPFQPNFEQSFKTPLEEPIQPRVKESISSPLGERSGPQPIEPFLGQNPGYTDFIIGERNLMERMKEPAIPAEKEETAQSTSRTIEEPLEEDFPHAKIGPSLEKPNPVPQSDHDDSTDRDHQAPKEREPEILSVPDGFNVLSQALNQKQNLAPLDTEANQTATASVFNNDSHSNTVIAVPISTSPEQAHKRSFFEDEGPEMTVEDEAAIEPPPKTTRTDADPPSQKIVDMEEEMFALPRISKKRESTKVAYEGSAVEKPHQSTQIDNVPSGIPREMDQTDTFKPEHLHSSAEPLQPGDLPGHIEVHSEDVAREVGLGNQSIKTTNEVDQGTDRREPLAQKGKKGKKQKSTASKSRADPQVIKTDFVDYNPSEYKSQGTLDADPPLQSIPPAVDAGSAHAYSEFATHDDRSTPHQQDNTTPPVQPVTTFDESASLLGTNLPAGAEASPRQDEEFSPFALPSKNKKSKKKKKQTEAIIWEDDTATAPLIGQEDEDTVQKSIPIPEPEPTTSKFNDLQSRPGEPPGPQSSYAEMNVGPLDPSARSRNGRNDYFGIQAQEADMGLDINPQVPPFELQEQGDDKAAINSEVPVQDVVGLENKSVTATKTESDHQAPQHIPDGKVIAVDEKSRLIEGPYLQARTDSQSMPERLGLNPEENVVGKGEDIQVLADKDALGVDHQAVEQAQNTPGWVAGDNGLQEQQMAREALGATTVPGSDDTQLVDPSVEDEVFAMPVSKKSKKKIKRRAHTIETIDPRDLEDPAYKEAIDQRISSMPRSRSSSPRESSKTTEDPTQSDRVADIQEGQASVVGIVAAGASVAENLARRDSKKSGKNKKKRKGRVWEGEELDIPETTTSYIQEEATRTLPSSEPNRPVSLTPPRSPEPLSTQQMEDYSTHDNRQVNRDSAVHVSDSPIVSDSHPPYRMVRDSGYQDTEASPIVGLRRSVSFDRMSTVEAPFVEKIAPNEEDQEHDVRENQVPERSAVNPYNIPIEADPAHATRALSPVLEVSRSRDASRSQNGHMDFAKEGIKASNDHPSPRPADDPPLKPISLNPVFPTDQRSAAGRSLDALDVLPSPQTHGDRREPSPVSPSSKDRSSVLFESSPSTREELTNIQQRSSSPLHEHRSGNERAISPIRVEKDAITHAAPDQSLFGGPRIADSERPSPPTSPTGMVDPARRPLDTIREYSAEESPLQRKTRIRPHSPSPERGNRRRRTADRQQGQRDQVPKIDTSNMISTDDIISGLSWPAVNEEEHIVDLERSRSRTKDNSRQSVISPSGEAPKPRSFSGASIRSTESINAIIRTPDQIRSASGLSYHSSGTPPLRRVDRSVSGDLRAKSLAKQSEPAPQTIASSSTYDPTKDKGKDRMADVYVSPELP